MTAELQELIRLLQAGRLVELESAALAVLCRSPDSGVAWQLLSVSLTLQGKDARPALLRAVHLMPQDAIAHINLGNSLARSGELNQAIRNYRRAALLRPAFVEAHNNLAQALLSSGQFAEAAASCRQAIALRPGFAGAHDNLGSALLGMGRIDEAETSFRRAVEIDPGFSEAHSNLGNAVLEQGQIEAALTWYRRALEIDPEFAAAHVNLGNALRAMGKIKLAVASYDRALQIMPNFAEAHCNRAIALRLLTRPAEAQAACRCALESDPLCASALIVLGELSADAGDFAEAERHFRGAMAIAPEVPEAWAGLASLHTMTPVDSDWLAHAERIVQRPLPPRKSVVLQFAIGKYFDDTRDFERAFQYFYGANELAKRHRPAFDRQGLTQTVDDIINHHARQWLAEFGQYASDSACPVLIVGMLRSGTTLAEQILASHPDVFGAGELPFWNDAFAGFCELRGEVAKRDVCGTLTNDYLQQLRGFSANAQRIIDKMPTNFPFLGLFHSLFPQARIIHMQRDPLDTCLSIYFQNFERVVGYANDLEDLAHYYEEYRRLMTHWHSSLPAGAMLEVPYEDMVANQEAWSRRMIEFIGLPWDERCLEYYHAQRTVLTASKWQVRQKISRASVGRWHNYETHLAPLWRLSSAALAGRSNCE